MVRFTNRRQVLPLDMGIVSGRDVPGFDQGFGPDAELGGATVYLLRDEFFTDDATPIVSPRACEPGPGTLTINDTTNVWGISGGELVPGAAGSTNNNPGIYHAAGFARQAGLALKARLKTVSAFGTDVNKTLGVLAGWAETAGEANLANIEGLIGWAANTKWQVVDSLSAATIQTLIDAATDTYNVNTVILRASGGSFFVLDNNLVFITRSNTDANVHPNVLTIGSNRHPPQIDYFKIGVLGSPWSDNYGIATQRLAGARANGDLFTHEANCHVEFTVTALPSAGNIQVGFRRQDASNMWRIDINNAGTLSVNEVVAGVPISRIPLAGVLVNDYIIVAANGTQMHIYRDRPASGIVNSSLYAAATNFQTATSGKVESLGTGGAISDLIAWPYQLSGSALAEINRI